MDRSRIRIVATDALAAGASDVDGFWQAMLAAAAGQAPHDLGDPRLDARYVGVATSREPHGDLATAWLERVCRRALEGARPKLKLPAAPRTALLVGSSLGGMTLFEAEHRGPSRDASPAGPGLPTTPASGWQARYDGPTRAALDGLGLRASAWTVNTACSSAANALGLARRWLRRGRIDLALVAGVDVISPFVFAGFSALRAVDPEPTSPFSEGRRGLNLGEAAVAMVLAREDDLVEPDSHVELAGYGSSCDAHHLTRPDLSGQGLALAIRAALDDGGVSANDVHFISAHATGTPFNDTMESAAFAQVFGNALPPLHCAKPVAGHTLGAAGIVDALLVHEALVRRTLPKTFRRLPADPELGAQPLDAPHPLDAQSLALSTSSGFGGSNAALLLRGVTS